jgi:hypothetical protein
MRSRLPITRKLLAACTMLVAASAHADITVYTDRAAFLNAVPHSATDSFDNLTMSETAGPLIRSAGPYGYQVSVGPGASTFYPSGTGSDVWLTGTMSSDVVKFGAFSSGVTGFGGNFFGTDSFGAFMPGQTVELTAIAGSDSKTYTLKDASLDSFVAFVSNAPLTSVSFQNMESNGTVYWAGANNVVLAVPEPTTWSMLLGGLAVTALGRRWRRKPGQSKTLA